MSFLAQLNELNAAKAKLASLESKFLSDREAALAALPAEYGYPDLKSFIKALTAAAKIRTFKKTAKTPKAAAKKQTRVKITPELKQAAITALQGTETAAAIAKQLGISLASVQNIKKAAGLVKARVSVSA